MNIDLIAVPTTYGCGKDGAQYGPDKLREFGLLDVLKLNHKVYDMGDINIPKLAEEHYGKKEYYLNPLVRIFESLAHNTYLSLNSGNFPIILGGDHSIAIGSIAGASKASEELAVIWIDAHGDINTFDTSTTSNIHGMPLAASMGIGDNTITDIYFKGQKLDKKNLYHLGARDLDPAEKDLIDKLDLNFYTMEKINEGNLEDIVENIIKDIKNSNVKNVHLSFDIDSLDSSIVPGTGTPVSGGFTMEEGKYILNKLLSSSLITSMDFVELNPILDKNDLTTNNCIEIMHTISNSLK